MRAVVCREFGNPAKVGIEDIPPPPMVEAGVRIAVHASGVSFANLLVIEGKHQNRPQLPFVPGTEVAGVVMECAKGVDRFRPGDRVVAGTRWGGYAAEAVAPVSNVFALPDAVDFTTAVQFPTIYATAYAALKWRARLREGETLLVHGAAGGSGLAAVEIGKILGARVIATAGTDRKLDIVRAHGADHQVNYRTADFREAVLDLTGGRGADVIFDPVGGDVFDRSLRCIAPEGRIVVIGFAEGRIPQAPANIVLVKNISVVGLYWGYYMGWAKQAPGAHVEEEVRAAFRDILDWCAAGRIRPVTHRVMDLSEFGSALEMIRSREVIGRVALLPRD